MAQLWRVVIGGGAAIGAAALALAPWIQHKPVPDPQAGVTTRSPVPQIALGEPVGANAIATRPATPTAKPLARLAQPPIGAAGQALPATRAALAPTSPPKDPPAQYIVKIEQSAEFDAIYALWRKDPEAARVKFRQWCASRDTKSSTLLEKLDLADTSPHSNEIILQSKVPAQNAQQSRQMARELSVIPGFRYAELNYSTNIEADKR